MKITITESQLNKFIIENIDDEGWMRDYDTNKMYWLKDNDNISHDKSLDGYN